MKNELRTLWSSPITRRTLLEKLEEAGYGKEELNNLQKLIHAEKSDLFDVLEYVFNGDIKPITEKTEWQQHRLVFLIYSTTSKKSLLSLY